MYDSHHPDSIDLEWILNEIQRKKNERKTQ